MVLASFGASSAGEVEIRKTKKLATFLVRQVNTDIDRIGKLLFSTTYANAFKAGSISMPGISKYQAFIGFFYAAQSTPMIGFRTGNMIIFTGSLIISGGSTVTAHSTVTLSGDIVTFDNGNPIIQIYGLF